MLATIRDYLDDTRSPRRHVVGALGKYEGEPPIVVYIDVHDCYDETSGDVEAPTGWFGRAGRWIVTHDSFGFVHGTKAGTLDEARKLFESLNAEYDEWSADDDDE